MQTQIRRINRVKSLKRALFLAKLMLPQSLVKPGYTQEELTQARLQWARHMYQNPKNCSCAMCCNPRHSPYHKGNQKLTMQERRAAITWREEVCHA